MRIDIPYGKEKIGLNIPDNNIQDIVGGGRAFSPGKSEEDLIRIALSKPIDSPTLKEMAAGKDSACILVSDITRPCPSHRFLPYIVDELISGRIDPERIKIIFGLGIHRGHTEEEKKRLVGTQVFGKVKVMDSDPDRARLVGKTSAGTPVEIFEEALGSGLLIATGNIEYHYFAGYSGGAKAVMPGICTRNSIQANHSMMLEEKAASGRVQDNPVRADIEEAGRMAGIDYIFNVILDDSKKIIDAVAGKNNQAWLAGIKRYDDIYMSEIEKPAHIVITSAGGYPKDLNLYQSQKALENVKDLVLPGGAIILAASCLEGFGEHVFEAWMKDARDYGLISSRLKRNFVLGGHKAVAVSRVISDKEVFLYSEFDRASTEGMGFRKIGDIQSYVDRRIKEDKGVKITVIPCGRFARVRKAC